MGWDSANNWDKGTGVLSLSRDKETTGQAKNPAMGQAGTVKFRDGMQDKTGHSRKGRCKTVK